MGAKDKRGGGPTPGSDRVYTGPLESKNDTQRAGRDDGFGPNQKTSGHKTESAFPTGPNAEQRVRPWVGTNHGEDLHRLPEKQVQRADSVQEIEP